jgi:Xaa-Pro aminopeptidase
MYLLDSGGQYLDGTTDITRTFYIGEPTKEQKEHYTLVLKGHIALAHIRFPKGTTGAQLDSLARQFLWNHGLDYAHGTGHGVGSYLNVHEGPQGINKIRQVPLEVGMVVSNEPGFYRENLYGIRIENLQMVKEAEHSNFLCFESLTLVPYESALIDYEMLSKAELDWLAAYYQNIWETVSPMLNEHEQEWLKKKLSKLQ